MKMSCLAENAKWQRASPWGSFNHGSLWLLPAALVIINQALTNCSATAPAADAAADAAAAREVAPVGHLTAAAGAAGAAWASA